MSASAGRRAPPAGFFSDLDFLWQETVAPPAADSGVVVSAAEDFGTPHPSSVGEGPLPLTLVRRWATVLLLVAGAIILIGRQLTGSNAGWATLPLPVPMRGQSGDKTGPSPGSPSTFASDGSVDHPSRRSGEVRAHRRRGRAGAVQPSEAAAAEKVISRAETELAANGTGLGGDVATASAEVAARASAYAVPASVCCSPSWR